MLEPIARAEQFVCRAFVKICEDEERIERYVIASRFVMCICGAGDSENLSDLGLRVTAFLPACAESVLLHNFTLFRKTLLIQLSCYVTIHNQRVLIVTHQPAFFRQNDVTVSNLLGGENEKHRFRARPHRSHAGRSRRPSRRITSNRPPLGERQVEPADERRLHDGQPFRMLDRLPARNHRRAQLDALRTLTNKRQQSGWRDPSRFMKCKFQHLPLHEWAPRVAPSFPRFGVS